MKWFKHLSSAYTDIAIRQIIEKYGIEGYGLFWICCELVAQQGRHFRLKKNQNWLKILELVSKIPEKKLLEILQNFSELNLIDTASFKKGDLYLKKMRKYADDYTDRVRRVFGQGSDSVHVDKSRIDKNRIEEGKTTNSLISYFYELVKQKRNFSYKPTPQDIKNLKSFLKSKSEEETQKIFDWYFTTEKSKEHFSISASISKHSLNLYEENKGKGKWQEL